MRSQRMRQWGTAVSVAMVAALVAPLTSASGAIGATALDGPVRAWGRNASGQLGDGTATGRTDPVAVTDLLDVAALEAGDVHSLALDAAGAVFSWGGGDRGQLGRGALGLAGSTVPQPVHAGETASPSTAPLTGVADVAAGARHSVVLHTGGAPSGRVYAFGANGSGQVGGVAGDQTSPSLVQFRLDLSDPLRPLEDVVEVAAGGDHSLALRADGVVFAFGSNSHGQLGNGLFGDAPSPIATRVAGLPVTVSALAAGATHSLALTSSGQVYAWGGGGRGQLGNGSATVRATVPIEVEGLPPIAAIAAGDHHSVVVATDGRVFAFGANGSGQLGDGTLVDRSRPVAVVDSAGEAVAGVFAAAAGSAHTVVLAGRPGDASVLATGANDDGQLGDGSTAARRAAAPTAGPVDTPVAVATGASHTLVVAAARARIAPTALDFGEVDVGAVSAASQVTFTNDGPGPVEVAAVEIDNSIEFPITGTTCLEAGGAPVELAEGASCTVDVAFAPGGLGHRGSGTGPATLTVASSAVGSPHTVSLTGIGIVRPGTLAVTVDPLTTPASPQTLAIDKVPFYGNSPNVLLAPSVPIDGVELAPGVPIDGVDLAPGVPIDGVDLAPVGLGGVPLAPGVPIDGVDLAPGVGLDGVDLAPAASAVLDSISLAQLPLLNGLSWYDLVPGLGPLHETSLGDVVRMEPTPEGFAGLRLSDLDLAATPLRWVSNLAWSLGDTPLGAYPIDPGRLCAAFEAQGHAGCGADLARSDHPAAGGLGASLLAAEVAGLDLRDLGLQHLPVSGFDLDGEAVVATPAGGTTTVRFWPAPATAVRLTELDFAANDAGSVAVGALDPARKCAIVDCAAVTDDQTLFQVAGASALRADAVVADLSTTLADWAIAPFNHLMLRAEDLPLTTAALDDLIANGLGLLGDGANRVTYRVHYVRDAGSPATGVAATLVLNHNVTPLASTGTVTIGGGAPQPLDPVARRLPDGRAELVWATDSIPAGATATFAIETDPGPREGAHSADAALQASSGSEPFQVAVERTALLRVTPNFEANDRLTDLDDRHLLAPGELAVNQLSHATDVDLFRVPVEGQEGVLVITNSQKEAPAVVSVYYPAAADLAPPQRAPEGALEEVLRLEDRGLSVRSTEGEDAQSSPPVLPDLGLAVADYSANPDTFQDVLTIPLPELRPAAPGEAPWARDVIVAVTPAAGGASKAGTSLLAARVIQRPAPEVATAEQCAPRTYPRDHSGYSWPSQLPDGTDTVYLVNASHLRHHDPAGFAQLEAELGLLAGHDRLGRFAVLALDSHDGWWAAEAARAADPCSVATTNASARLTSDVLDALDPSGRLTGVGINVLGGHGSVAMSWLADFSPLSVGNELVYATDYAHAGGDGDIARGLARGHFPTDAPLASTDVYRVAGSYVYDQDRVLARSVGTASDLAAAIAHLRATGGEFALDDATVASTDAFMDFLGDVVAGDLAAHGVAVDRLRDQWTGDQLTTALAAGRDLVAQNVHGAAEMVLAPDGSRIDASDLRAAAAAGAPATSVFAGIDCHVGLGGDALDSALDGLSALSANSALNTTYGYGLDGALALHGRTHALFIEALLEGHPVAQAWTVARQRSVLEDPQFGSLAEKAYGSAVFYGLTAWRVAGSTPPGDPGGGGSTRTDPLSGLTVADVDEELVPGVDLRPSANADGAFWVGPGGAVTFASGEPIQPAASFPLALDGAVGGALLTGLQTQLAGSGVDLAHATTELAGGVGSHYESQAPFDDSRLLAVRQRGDRTVLALKAGFATGFRQAGGSLVADEHLVTGFQAEVFEVPDGAEPSASPPQRHRITEIERPGGVSVAFVADTDPDRPASRVVGSVLASDGTWHFTELAAVGDRFAGLVVLPDGTSGVLAFLQTLSATGVVVQTPMSEPADDLGELPGLTVKVSGDRAPSGAFIEPLVELIPANPAALVRFGINGAPLEEYTGAFRLTGPEQLHCITVEVSDLDEPHEFCVHTEGLPTGPETPPDVVVRSPAAGAQVVLGSDVAVVFACRDGNGVASQSGQVLRDGEPVGPVYSGSDGQPLVTDDVGAHVLRISCTDHNGHAATVDVRYQVVFSHPGDLLSPILNPPEVNEATAGRGVKVQFVLTDAAGQYAAQEGDVVSLRSYETAAGNCTPTSCPNIHHEGNTTIRYQDGKVMANWQTEEGWRGSARTLVITLRDGTSLSALFQFKT